MNSYKDDYSLREQWVPSSWPKKSYKTTEQPAKVRIQKQGVYGLSDSTLLLNSFWLINCRWIVITCTYGVIIRDVWYSTPVVEIPREILTSFTIICPLLPKNNTVAFCI